MKKKSGRRPKQNPQGMHYSITLRIFFENKPKLVCSQICNAGLRPCATRNPKGKKNAKASTSAVDNTY
jgi:hypothetical protein